LSTLYYNIQGEAITLATLNISTTFRDMKKIIITKVVLYQRGHNVIKVFFQKVKAPRRFQGHPYFFNGMLYFFILSSIAYFEMISTTYN